MKSRYRFFVSLQRPPHQLVATVIGAGTMGAQIAAHLANAGVRTHLLDMVPRDVGRDAPAAARNALALGAVKQLSKMQPAPLMHASAAERIHPGNLEDDLERAVGQSDLVIEAVVERLDVKKPLFARIAASAPAHAVLATNTSGLPIGRIAEDLPDEARRRVVGMHFFNPPRYMHLLEIVSSEATDPAVAEALARFGERVLGKGIVPCPDTPNFIGNRIGIAEMLLTFRCAFDEGYTVEEVDLLNGPLMGRPKTGSFRLGDLVGIDVAAMVIENLAQATSADPAAANYDETHDTLTVHPSLRAILEKGLKGDKVGQGFYKKTKEKGASGRSKVLSLDLQTLAYRPRQEPAFPELAAIAKERDVRRRVHLALRAEGRAGEFLRAVYLPLFNYAAHRLGQVSRGPKEIDDAMRWGYGWELGPFALWDAVGVAWTAERLAEMGVPLAPAAQRLLETKPDDARWYGGNQVAPTVFIPAEGRDIEVPRPRDTLSLGAAKEAGGILHQNASASLIDLGDGVACFEIHSRGNSLDEHVLALLRETPERLSARRDFRALVIGNDADLFCSGADLAMLGRTASEGKWSMIEQTVAGLQQMYMALRHGPLPVVAAVRGRALGGGCELLLHTAAVVAHVESYIGLVEVGVGLLPAAGGLKEIVRRGWAWAREAPEPDPYPWIRRGFEATSTAKVSLSAAEAVDLGYLRSTDTIVFHRDHVLARAKAQAIALAETGWQPPDPEERIGVIGASRGASLFMGARLFAWAGYASEHDKKIAEKIAHVLSGGMDPFGRPRTAQQLLDLEREAFLALCGEPKTQERIRAMLETKRPLRN